MDLNFEGTKEEKAEYYSENWEHITGLDYADCVPSEINRLDFLNGYNEALKDTKAIEVLEALRKMLKAFGEIADAFGEKETKDFAEKAIEKAQNNN